MAKALLAWYGRHRRILPWREDPTPYQVWVSEIMLQQTRVEAAKGYYWRFLEAFPGVEALAEAEEDEYLKLWQGLGYYSRVRNLHAAAVLLCEEHGGQLPAREADLLKLPGIGPYTAAAIASICYGENAPAIDGNLLRVFARLTCYEDNILTPAAQKEARAYFVSWMEALWPGGAGAPPAPKVDPQSPSKAGPARTPANAGSNTEALCPGTLNQALMDLGATVCLPNATPLCADCPLHSACAAHQKGRETDLPLRIKKQSRAIDKMTLLLIHFDDGVLLRKRPDLGLLAGLYEYPHAPGHLTQNEALRYVEALGFSPVRIAKLPPAKHLFSHREWHMHAYEVWADQWTDFTRRAPERPKEDGASAAHRVAEGDSSRLFIADAAAIEKTWSIPSAYAPYTDYLLGR